MSSTKKPVKALGFHKPLAFGPQDSCDFLVHVCFQHPKSSNSIKLENHLNASTTNNLNTIVATRMWKKIGSKKGLLFNHSAAK